GSGAAQHRQQPAAALGRGGGRLLPGAGGGVLPVVGGRGPRCGGSLLGRRWTGPRFFGHGDVQRLGFGPGRGDRERLLALGTADVLAAEVFGQRIGGPAGRTRDADWHDKRPRETRTAGGR